MLLLQPSQIQRWKWWYRTTLKKATFHGDLRQIIVAFSVPVNFPIYYCYPSFPELLIIWCPIVSSIPFNVTSEGIKAWQSKGAIVVEVIYHFSGTVPAVLYVSFLPEHGFFDLFPNVLANPGHFVLTTISSKAPPFWTVVLEAFLHFASSRYASVGCVCSLLRICTWM